jgi:hypothetical protein
MALNLKPGIDDEDANLDVRITGALAFELVALLQDGSEKARTAANQIESAVASARMRDNDLFKGSHSQHPFRY